MTVDSFIRSEYWIYCAFTVVLYWLFKQYCIDYFQQLWGNEGMKYVASMEALVGGGRVYASVHPKILVVGHRWCIVRKWDDSFR